MPKIWNIVFLDRETLPPQTRLREVNAPHTLSFHERTAESEVVARAAEADIIITNKVPLRRAALERLPNLRMVAIAATGTDIVDLDCCRSRGVVVSNIREYAGATVPEHTFALMLALSRSIIPYHGSVGQGRWRQAGQFCYFDYPIANLAGKVLGVIGDGVLGRAVGRLGEAFGMKVLFSSYKGVDGMGPLYTPFEEVIANSDVITLHCPLTPATRDMIGADEFAAMRRRPLIINTARGGLVNEKALADALQAGQISGAGFDVVSSEPMPEDHPFCALLQRPDFILTPHVAWASAEATQGLADQLVGNIESFIGGSPRNVVNA